MRLTSFFAICGSSYSESASTTWDTYEHHLIWYKCIPPFIIRNPDNDIAECHSDADRPILFLFARARVRANMFDCMCRSSSL